MFLKISRASDRTIARLAVGLISAIFISFCVPVNFPKQLNILMCENEQKPKLKPCYESVAPKLELASLKPRAPQLEPEPSGVMALLFFFKAIRWAIELYCRSPVAYQHIKSSAVMALPSTNTVENSRLTSYLIVFDIMWLTNPNAYRNWISPSWVNAGAVAEIERVMLIKESFACCNAAWTKWRVGSLHGFWAVSLTWKYFFLIVIPLIACSVRGKLAFLEGSIVEI